MIIYGICKKGQITTTFKSKEDAIRYLYSLSKTRPAKVDLFWRDIAAKPPIWRRVYLGGLHKAHDFIPTAGPAEGPTA